MAKAAELSERKATILRALVRHYIRTGEPVGSESLAAVAGLSVSSATIRNELASLEELGYLSQPHPSAGRVPTDLAYRFFVDLLPANPRIRDAERQAIVRFFDEALADVDEILRGTTHLLSRLTRYAALALAPNPREMTIARAELVSLGTGNLLLLIFETGVVEKRMIDLPPDVTERDVEAVSNEIVRVFRGRSVAHARRTAVDRARTAGERERDVYQRVADALAGIEATSDAEHVIVGGVANIAARDAFLQRETLRQIYETLERESAILRLLREAARAQAGSVLIGREIPLPGMAEASVVTAPFGSPRTALGTIGVVGPIRMDYVTAISAVRLVADRLSAAVEALRG